MGTKKSKYNNYKMILLVTVFDVISATAPDPFLIQILGS